MKTVKAVRIVLVCDEAWAGAISEITSYAIDGEVCFYESWSEPFDYELEDSRIICNSCGFELEECECED